MSRRVSRRYPAELRERAVRMVAEVHSVAKAVNSTNIQLALTTPEC